MTNNEYKKEVTEKTDLIYTFNLEKTLLQGPGDNRWMWKLTVNVNGNEHMQYYSSEAKAKEQMAFIAGILGQLSVPDVECEKEDLKEDFTDDEGLEESIEQNDEDVKKSSNRFGFLFFAAVVSISLLSIGTFLAFRDVFK